MTAVVVHRHFRSLRPASPLPHLPCRLRPTIGAPLQTPIMRYGSFTFYCTISRFSLTSSIVSAPLASSPTKDSPFISITSKTNVWMFEVPFLPTEHQSRCRNFRVLLFLHLTFVTDMIAMAPRRNVGSSTEVAPRYKSREPTSVLTPVPVSGSTFLL